MRQSVPRKRGKPTATGKKLTRYKVAAVQAAPVFLDREATLAKAASLIREAAAHGAALAVFPETWIPGYPVWASATAFWNYAPAKKAYNRLYQNAVDVPGPATEYLGKVAREAGVCVAMGVNERTPSGTMYNSIVFIGADGQLLGKHRKLVPTYHERMVWGQGDGSTLKVFDTAIGRLGGLVCWEHWMPLARYALYQAGEQVHASLWPAAGDTFHLACRNMAFEGRVFVIVACSYLTRAMVPADFELMKEIESLPEILCRGGSAIIAPDARYLAGPVYNQETILYADIDLAQIIEEKQALDVVGHYARPEVFTLTVDRREITPVTFRSSMEEGEPTRFAAP
ncbi:MAG: carbon-nitrogen hydrolase family protein [Chloroflexi bacterium]|nr:carbon-nitrogen hydrolase family protein [Chloroflexota bacterium]